MADFLQHRPHVDSWYAASANRHLSFEALRGETRSDICIVGGGYTGLSTAIHLRRLGYSVSLLEAHRIAWGASGRNGGHAGTGQRVSQTDLERWLGREHSRALWDLGLEAVDTVCQLIDDFNISCELKSGNLHIAAKASECDELRAHVEHLQTHYDYKGIRYIKRSELAQMSSAKPCHGATFDSGARHLHPLNYALGLAAAASGLGAKLYEGSRVITWREDSQGQVSISTDQGLVRANYLVLACNGYLDALAPRNAGNIMPINNYMLATEPLTDALAQQLIRDDCSMTDTLFVVNYWKLSADRRLLFGGGESYRRRMPKDIAGFVRKRMLRIYPELANTRIDYGWGGTLAITMNRMPDFGRLSATTFYAQGYSGHGLPVATLAGKLLAEVIDGSAGRFDIMANVPTRKFPGGTLLRWPALVAGMLFFSLRDRLG
ncbi:MAG: NAD(P)/FAD-dependent oxidoreductase [Parahaliea sp.]